MQVNKELYNIAVQYVSYVILVLYRVFIETSQSIKWLPEAGRRSAQSQYTNHKVRCLAKATNAYD